MRQHCLTSIAILLGICGNVAAAESAPLAARKTVASAFARGSLRVHPTNPRYFTDGTKLADGSLQAVYLTGSLTWNKPGMIFRP